MLLQGCLNRECRVSPMSYGGLITLTAPARAFSEFVGLVVKQLCWRLACANRLTVWVNQQHRTTCSIGWPGLNRHSSFWGRGFTRITVSLRPYVGKDWKRVAASFGVLWRSRFAADFGIRTRSTMITRRTVPPLWR